MDDGDDGGGNVDDVGVEVVVITGSLGGNGKGVGVVVDVITGSLGGNEGWAGAFSSLLSLNKTVSLTDKMGSGFIISLVLFCSSLREVCISVRDCTGVITCFTVIVVFGVIISSSFVGLTSLLVCFTLIDCDGRVVFLIKFLVTEANLICLSPSSAPLSISTP